MKNLFFSTITLVAVLLSLTNEVNAQIVMGVQVGVSTSTGYVAEGIKLGVGANLQSSYFLHPKLAVGATISYYKFDNAKQDGLYCGTEADKPTFLLGIMGVTPTIQYFLSDNKFKTYIGTDLGYYRIFTHSVESFIGLSPSLSMGYLGVAPHIGVLYNLNTKVALNINLKCNTTIFSSGTAVTTFPVNGGILYTFR